MRDNQTILNEIKQAVLSVDENAEVIYLAQEQEMIIMKRVIGIFLC